MVILSRFKISGHSMIPTLNPNQEILVSSLPYIVQKPKINDLIAFKDQETAVIKRIKKISGNKYYVEGDNKKDSKNYGWIEKQNLMGKVIHIFAT